MNLTNKGTSDTSTTIHKHKHTRKNTNNNKDTKKSKALKNTDGKCRGKGYQVMLKAFDATLDSSQNKEFWTPKNNSKA